MKRDTDPFVKDRLPPPAQWPEYRYDTLELAALAVHPRLNIVGELLDRRVNLNGWRRRPFLRDDTRTLTYADAQRHVNRIAKLLLVEYDLQPGQRVLLRGGNSISMALAWLAVVKAGLVAVATMPLLRAKELGDIIDKAQPALALCDAKLMPDLQTALKSYGQPVPLLPFNDGDQPQSMEKLAERHDGAFVAGDTAAHDVAMLAFTSGTTGKPKAVVHRHLDVLTACEAWPRHLLRATPDDVVVGSPPLAFTFGLGGLLLFPLWAGASIYYPGVAYTPERMAKLFGEVGATICYTAPTFYRQMAAFMPQYPAPKLRICVSAGEALPDATRQLWKRATGIEMLDGIGATEMFHIFISSAGADVKPGAIGQVVPGYQAKVVDEHFNEVPRGTVGRLAVKGPTGCLYMDDDRQTRYVHDGWNLPGDAFVQDADGYFVYQSRADDMIITAGYNVGGVEVEDCLLQHPAVAECGVIGKPDEERGMVVMAVVVLKPGHAGDATMVHTLQEHVKANLAPYKYPRHIEFATHLPRTETGKLQRFKLKNW